MYILCSNVCDKDNQQMDSNGHHTLVPRNSLCKGINGLSKGCITLSVTWNLEDHKLVVCLGCMWRAKADRHQELELNNADHKNWERKQNVCWKLALWWIVIVNHVGCEKIPEAYFLQEVTWVNIEIIQLLCDVTAWVELEKVQNVAVHEIYIDLRSLLTIESLVAGRYVM